MSKKFIGTKSHSNRKASYAPLWDVKSLREYFASIELPTCLKMSQWWQIDNVEKFVNAHLDYIEHNNGNMLFLNYYNRLLELKEILEKIK